MWSISFFKVFKLIELVFSWNKSSASCCVRHKRRKVGLTQIGFVVDHLWGGQSARRWWWMIRTSGAVVYFGGRPGALLTHRTAAIHAADVYHTTSGQCQKQQASGHRRGPCPRRRRHAVSIAHDLYPPESGIFATMEPCWSRWATLAL